MPLFFWNPLSITLLIILILFCLVATFFFHQLYRACQARRSFRSVLLLLISFSAYAVGMAFQLLSEILHPDDRNIALPWVGPCAVVGMAGYVLFFYHYQRPANWGRRGSHILIVLFVAIFCFESYVAAVRHRLLLDGIVEFRDAWFDIHFAVFYLLGSVFLFGRIIDGLAKASGNSWLGSVLPAVSALFWRRKSVPSDTRGVRAFFYVSIMPFLVGLASLGRSYGFMDWRLTLLLDAWIIIMAVCSFAVVYLNYVPEYTSFRVKLVGVSLTTVLLIMSGVSWLIGPVFEDFYKSDHQITQGAAIRFVPQANGAYIARRTAYRFETGIGEKLDNVYEPVGLPFTFTFFGEHFRSLFLSHSGMVGLKQTPLWRDVQYRFGPQPAIFANAVELKEANEEGYRSGVYMNSADGHVIITWNHLVSAAKPDEFYTFQLRLYATGVIEIAYSEAPRQPLHDVYLAHAAPMMVGIVPGWIGRHVANVHFLAAKPFLGEPGEGLIEHHRLEFLVFLNRIYMPIAMFSLIASFLVLVIYPYFFTVNLDRPLQKLLGGVQQIIGGKLATSIEISYRDEIGYLAESFNRMAKAQYELTQTLEDKVAARTAEVRLFAEKNARLEERNRLSRELHDAVSQTLFSANLITDTMPTLIEKNPERAFAAMAEVRQLNKNALAEMRNLLFELRGNKISTHTFARLLREIIDGLEKTHSLQVSLEVDSDTILPENIQLTFYRIAQECLANTAKHAGTKEISVYFDGAPSQAILTVRDNGRGFAQYQISTGSFGLQIMKERMQEIGGTLEIDSAPGRGTTVTAIWFDKDVS